MYNKLIQFGHIKFKSLNWESNGQNHNCTALLQKRENNSFIAVKTLISVKTNQVRKLQFRNFVLYACLSQLTVDTLHFTGCLITAREVIT